MRQLKIPIRAGRPLQGRMRAPILTVASGEIPRRRTFIRLVSMGNKIAKLQDSDRSPQDDCVFCDIVKGVGRGKIFEDEQLVAFHDHHPAARVHILVVPKQHIISTRHLRNNQEDRELLEAMLEVGSRLIAEHDGHGKLHDRSELGNSSLRSDPEPSQTKFGFHTPPFLTVAHLHLHCFALPHRPSWMGYQFLQTPRGSLGFITVEQALQQLQAREPEPSEGKQLLKLPNGKVSVDEDAQSAKLPNGKI